MFAQVSQPFFGDTLHRVRIVKNELGGSATQQELRGWGVGRVTME